VDADNKKAKVNAMTFRHVRPAKHASSRKKARKARSGMPIGAKGSAKIRILLLDERPLLREGVINLINRQVDMVVCGDAGSIPSGQIAITGCKPDLLLLDLRLGGGDALEFIKALRTQNPELLILAFSQFEETIFAERVLRAGANGYLMNNASGEELLRAMRDILQGRIYVSRKVAMLAFQKSLQTPRQGRSQETLTAIENLSDREMHVFQLLGSSLGTKKIAEALNRSVKTIESHRENIKRKLGLRSGTELTERATAWMMENFRRQQKDAIPAIAKISASPDGQHAVIG
jgi:DNA-binding NarL/FixJ family response regulator